MRHSPCSIKPEWAILLFTFVGTAAFTVPMPSTTSKPSIVVPDAGVTLWMLTQPRL